MVKRNLRLLGVAVLALTMTGPLASASGGPSAPNGGAASVARTQESTPEYGGTFIYAQHAEMENLNPATTFSGEVASGGSQVYNALLRQNDDLSMRPSLAESWEVSEDGTTYTFHLVEGVTWHDGEPFTSADVKFTIEQIVLPYHPQGEAMFGRVTSIETPDDLTVVFTLERAFPPFLQYLSVDGAPILPKHLWEGTDILENPLNFEPVGTGPFIFEEWVRGSHAEFVRNPNYWDDGKPYLDRVIIRFMPDPNARIQALEAGEIDAIFGYFPFSEYARLAEDPRFEATTTGSERLASISTNLTFNLRHEEAPYANLEVRQAIAHALDKALIVELATFNVSEQARAHIPMGLDWSNPDTVQYEYDVARAEELLDAAGYPRNDDGVRFSTTLSWNSGDAEHTKSAEVIAQQLGEVGIEVQLIPQEPATWSDAVFINADFEMTLRGIGTGPDPGISALWRSYHTENIVPERLHNSMAYSNDRVDELFDMAEVEVDQERRNEYFREIQAILMEELPSIPITERSDPKVWRAVWDGDVVAGPSAGRGNSWDNVWMASDA